MTVEDKKPEAVLVTGASGYIASWVVKYLLDEGFAVHGTVRSLNEESRYRHLQALAGAKERLRLFEADLLHEGSFDAAMEACAAVFHTASPFRAVGIKNPRMELIEPAVSGTGNVLRSAGRSPGVRRVVLTSSVAAIYGDAADVQEYPGGIMTEANWNNSSSDSHQAYSYSKTLAEKEAWKIAKEQNRWQLVVINPGFVFGPSLTPRTDSTSINSLLAMLNGKYRAGVPDYRFAMVDVRDVARAHVNALLRPGSSGRHILAAETLGFVEMARLLREYRGDRYPIPKSALPSWLLYAVGPFMGFGWKFNRRNLGIPVAFDNTYSKTDLGIDYRPMRQTLLDHLEQIERDGLLG